MSKRRVGSNPTFPTTPSAMEALPSQSLNGQTARGAGDRVGALLALPRNQDVVAACGDVGIRAVDVVDARLQLLHVEKLFVLFVTNR